MSLASEAQIRQHLADARRTLDDLPVADVEFLIDVLFQAWRAGRQIFLIGNGGSAGTASHMACDLNKCTIVPGQGRMKAFALVDNIPLVSALTNDDGWENIYVEQLKNFFQPGDVVLAISVHGGSGADKAGAWSQNLLRALEYAREHGGVACALAGFDGGAMKQMADVCVVVPANSTPLVESFHVLLHHVIASCLAERIRADQPRPVAEAAVAR